ncbi:unnamed protein product [Penicillium nalgiovense]|uniref:Uncharacterized protein n=1 Tax=Penicillium nalgiovense TaxID=60175 RepID=A0A1V6XKA2_PENNA|nr:hypothetical protein PENNAL_c0072G02625 [Penicillium nalgiovense]CAG7938844.1 unnamed protein product [Penicillium nalgiovense]CAG7949359.1 unnamed protein product [Penicillium nalgiovense]CAG7960656.1 unnamed protein product [Penicillium nalgiovense]CAG7962809.1 unnamed protein product [Penicillium nalgiovense]
MGNKISAVHGVKSDHFYDQGNAVNEIWVGDVEVISRLPFGDSDLEQAGWPPGDFPKIPWHHFIIPMQKRDQASNMTARLPSWADATCPDPLPEHGYLGMYRGVSSPAAYFIGTFFLALALVMYRGFLTMVSNAFLDWQYLRGASHRYPDPAAIRRTANRNLWTDLGKAFTVVALSILCLVLGAPALAAATRTMNAASFVLSNAFGGGLGALISVVVIPLLFLWCTIKPHRVTTICSRAEDSNPVSRGES